MDLAAQMFNDPISKLSQQMLMLITYIEKLNFTNMQRISEIEDLTKKTVVMLNKLTSLIGQKREVEEAVPESCESEPDDGQVINVPQGAPDSHSQVKK